jgi:Ca2+-binding RTX toxin-like protein
MKLFKSRNKRASRNGFEKRNRRRSNRALRAELLEDKILLAGDLDIVLDTSVIPNELYVAGTGSGEGDKFTVEDIDLGVGNDDDVQVKIWINNASPAAGTDPDLRGTYDTSTLKAMALLNGAIFTGFKLHGGAKNDVMDASGMKFQGDVTLWGEDGNDTLTGGKRADAMHGGGGDDLLLDADTLDTALTGGDRQDELLWRAGVSGVNFLNADIEIVNGTAGNDTIDSRGGSFQKTDGGGRGVTVDAGGGEDKVWGSDNGDTLSGGTGKDTISGEGGNDTINGDAGEDNLSGGAGNDTINGGADKDTISGGDGDDALNGGLAGDTISGDAGKDTIHGDEGNDVLAGGTENDKLFGDDGDDVLTGGPGADEINGGNDVDTAVYSSSAGGITLDLGNSDWAKRVSGGDAEGDKLTNIENVIGSATGDNNMKGDSGPNTLVGGAGNDFINGSAGDDIIEGKAGSDTLVGESGSDIIDGGDGDDVIEGDGIIGNGTDNSKPAGTQTDGDDLLEGGSGNDTIFANYNNVANPHKDLDPNNAVGTDVLFGNDGDDHMRGDGGIDTLQGDDGSDNMAGLNGKDVLIDGNSPNDVLTTEFDPSLGTLGLLADRVVITGSGPDTIIVTGTVNPLDRAIVQNQFDNFNFDPVSDYVPSIDTLLFV